MRKRKGTLCITTLLIAAPLGSAQFLVEEKLTPPPVSGGDYFGAAVSIDDGTVVIGAYHDDDVVTDSGAVYVYKMAQGTLSLQQKLKTRSAAFEDIFGSSVAISGDTLIASAGWDDDHGTNAGAVFVFQRSGSTWNQQQRLVSGNTTEFDGYGSGLAICGDTAVVGATSAHSSAFFAGSAYVFVRGGETWTLQQELWASDADVYDLFGREVGVWGDTIVVGAMGNHDVGSGGGAAYVFERSGTTWAEAQRLTVTDTDTLSQFGNAVAIHGDTIAVGAHRDSPLESDSGSAYVFVRSGSTWVEQQKLVPSDGDYTDEFGESVSISGDTLVVGAHRAETGSCRTGAGYVFTRQGGLWSEAQRIWPPQQPYWCDGGNFGCSIAFEGDMIVAGSRYNSPSGHHSGAAFVFKQFSPTFYCDGKPNSLGCTPYLSYAGEMPSLTAGDPFQVEGNDLVPNAAALFLYGSKPGNLSHHGGRLCVKAPFKRWQPATLTKGNGSAPCTGTLSRNFSAHIQAGNDPLLTAGRKVTIQLMYRDVADPAGFGDGLTDGLRFAVFP